MKTFFHIFILSVIGISSVYAQKEEIMKHIYDPYVVGIPERYDYKRTENGTKGIVYEENDWIIEIWKLKESGNGTSYEYAPAIDFYEIIKYYHPNGMIKQRGKYMCGEKIGKWEYFDEHGKLQKVVDEDAKFKDLKIKREDVLLFLEKEGWFNRQTGEHKIIDEGNRPGYALTTPLSTSGSFYRTLQFYFHIGFDPAVIKDGREITPPLWGITINNYNGGPEFRDTDYQINARTGEYKKEESSELIDM